ncbi:MAG: hypothetical protein GXN91_01050 [Epsilonproteobacteria bacterium]|nr:hypothetical protein [Campylobacterota bacterium]
MRKIALSALLALMLYGGDHDLYPQSISLVMGYSINSTDSNLENSLIHGLRYTQNIYNASPWAVDAFQLAFDMASDIEYLTFDESTSVARFAGNLLWTMDNPSNLTPFFLFGAGVSYVTHPKEPQSSLSLFSNIGGGVEMNIRSDIALVSEVKYIYEDPKKRYLNTNVGLKFSFGD